MTGADIHGSNLMESDFKFATLVHANLEGCNLIGANVYGVDWSYARLKECMFYEQEEFL